MATSIKSTQLDFNQIKENLKTHLLASDDFSDYDFEASGLSSLLDVLAYNTHYNGLIANFALNEAFLATAQLRSSALAISEGLGYNPRSKTSATATVNLSVTITDSGRPATVTLPALTSFTATVEDKTYNFWTLENYTASDDGAGLYNFVTSTGSTAIPIVEGQRKTKSFVADKAGEAVYIIPDENMDTSTATVKVYESRSSSRFDTYLPLATAATVTDASTLYTLREGANGYFTLIFGDGITTGKTPAIGEFIQVTYLTSKGALSNTASTFTTDAEITVNSVDYAIDVSTVSNAAGGSEKESISSIRTNAPITFAAQNRLVTAQDYIALIKRNYGTYLDDVTAWGGEDNIPPNFGKAYVSLRFKSGIDSATQTSVKNNIQTSLSKNLSIMSIDTLFSDAITTFIETETFFNFDPALTSSTATTIEGQINDLIKNYFTTNLTKFNSVFRRSLILAEVDDLSEAILNSRMDVKVQQRITPTLNANRDYSLSFPVELEAPNNVGYSVSSTAFTQSGKTVTIRNKINTNQLEAVTADGEVVVTNIGSYNATAGTVKVSGLNPSSILGSFSYIKISVKPANQSTIKPLRNYILALDEEESFSSSTLDYQDIKATL